MHPWVCRNLLGVLLLVTGASFWFRSGHRTRDTPQHGGGRCCGSEWQSSLRRWLLLNTPALSLQNLNFLWGLWGHRSDGACAGFCVGGVSFYAFQAISYLIDVYLEIIPAERHFGRFAIFMALFAKIVQGPIERGENLLPQLRDPPALSLADLASGMRLFAWGLFKKVVVADRLAVFVDVVYATLTSSRSAVAHCDVFLRGAVVF